MEYQQGQSKCLAQTGYLILKMEIVNLIDTQAAVSLSIKDHQKPDFGNE